MKPRLARLTGSAVLFMITIAFGCANDPKPLSIGPESEASHALLTAAASEARSVVVRVEERDDFADGVVDLRYTSTTWYDARGGAVKEVLDNDEPADGAIDARTTYLHSYNQHGCEVWYSIDYDHLADGTIDNRTTIVATEFDEHGNPTRYVYSWDEDADGAVDGITEWFTEYDARGNLLKRIDPPSAVREYSYDAHGNRIQEGNRTSKYNSHDQLIHMIDDDGVSGTTELSTIACDRQGNPTEQVILSTNSAGTVERTTRSITYDNHRNVLSVLVKRDGSGDGTVDAVTRIEYQYSGVDRHLAAITPTANQGVSPVVSTLESGQNHRKPIVDRSLR